MNNGETQINRSVGVALLIVDVVEPSKRKQWAGYFPAAKPWSEMLTPVQSPKEFGHLSLAAQDALIGTDAGLLIVYIHWSALYAPDSDAKVRELDKFACELRGCTPAIECIFLGVSDGSLNTSSVTPGVGHYLRLLRAKVARDPSHSEVAKRHVLNFEPKLISPLRSLVQMDQMGREAVEKILSDFDRTLCGDTKAPFHSQPESVQAALVGGEQFEPEGQFYQIYLLFCAALAVRSRLTVDRSRHRLFSWELWKPFLSGRATLWLGFPEISDLLKSPEKFENALWELTGDQSKVKELVDRLLVRARPDI